MHGLVSEGYVFEVEGMQHVAYGGGDDYHIPERYWVPQGVQSALEVLADTQPIVLRHDR